MHLLHGGSQIRSAVAEFPGFGIFGSLRKISEATPLHETFRCEWASSKHLCTVGDNLKGGPSCCEKDC